MLEIFWFQVWPANVLVNNQTSLISCEFRLAPLHRAVSTSLAREHYVRIIKRSFAINDFAEWITFIMDRGFKIGSAKNPRNLLTTFRIVWQSLKRVDWNCCSGDGHANQWNWNRFFIIFFFLRRQITRKSQDWNFWPPQGFFWLPPPPSLQVFRFVLTVVSNQGWSTSSWPQSVDSFTEAKRLLATPMSLPFSKYLLINSLPVASRIALADMAFDGAPFEVHTQEIPPNQMTSRQEREEKKKSEILGVC